MAYNGDVFDKARIIVDSSQAHWADVHVADIVLRKNMEWDKWLEEIPYVSWPVEWEVKAVPPFGCAVVRYLIKCTHEPDAHKRVSVYLDCYGMLGAVYQPYWEVYPGAPDGDPARCYMHEIDELKTLVAVGLEYRDKEEA